MSLILVIGNKNYSSWSLRAALALELTDEPYEERRILLRQRDTSQRISEFSPSGRVPVLLTEQGPIWDSLAIAEYLAERFPEAHLWPRGEYARAVARSVCVEMHSGFSALRTHLPMDLRRRAELQCIPEDAREDIQRICALWQFCRRHFGADGPFLFGHATVADAFYAPVAARFYSYQVGLSEDATAYVAAVSGQPFSAGTGLRCMKRRQSERDTR